MTWRRHRGALPRAPHSRASTGTMAHAGGSSSIAVQHADRVEVMAPANWMEAMNRRAPKQQLARSVQDVLLRNPVGYGIVVAAGALAVSALVNRQMAKRAERRNPPLGHFLEVDGVRLHYIERGKGEPLVLLHGNGGMIQDFAASGLVDTAAKQYRVIVFDRPGYGYSTRPRGRVWTPEAQADLLHRALEKIHVSRAIVLGHSWGASVAVALALKYPESVRRLVLAAGYYYPSLRADVVPMGLPAVPVIGDIVRHTISPVAGRLLWPLLMRRIFGPAPVPRKFARFPREMAVRPSQLRASAAESLLMIPDAVSYAGTYADLRMPVVIIAGDEDRHVDTDRQSNRLHRQVKQSVFYRVHGAGHMVHQTATAAVMSAIDETGGARRSGQTIEVPAAA